MKNLFTKWQIVKPEHFLIFQNQPGSGNKNRTRLGETGHMVAQY